MNWLSDWISGHERDLDEAQAQRLSAWKSLPDTGCGGSLDEMRLVVVDTETSGLDLRRDHLIAIGAVAIEGGRVQLADSLDVVLRQEAASSRDNILIHGIGGDAQCEGADPVNALLDFLDFVGKGPLLAFHAAFDRTMIGKTLKARLGVRFVNEWVDLAHAAPALHPDLAARHHSLDQWLGHFSIGNFARHSALADALACAELMLALRPRIRARKLHSFRALQELCGSREASSRGG